MFLLKCSKNPIKCLKAELLTLKHIRKGTTTYVPLKDLLSWHFRKFDKTYYQEEMEMVTFKYFHFTRKQNLDETRNRNKSVCA